MSSSMVKMVIRVGSDEVPLGECHAAQARGMVKKEYASWQDGKLLILGRPAFLKIMMDGNHWLMEGERPDVSERELDRRKIWFKDFMTNATKAVLKTIEPPKESRWIGSGKSANPPRFMVEEISTYNLEPEDELYFIDRGVMEPLKEKTVSLEPDDNFLDKTDEEIYESEQPAPEQDLSILWDGEELKSAMRPRYHGFFTPMRTYFGPGVGVSVLESVPEAEAVEVFRNRKPRDMNSLSIAGEEKGQLDTDRTSLTRIKFG